MATYASRKTGELLKNAFRIVAVELLTAAQAIDMRGEDQHSHLGAGARATYDFVRKNAPFIQQDAPLSGHMEALTQELMAGALCGEIERACGESHSGR
jgi:histidine ammonia-lyase